MLTAILAALRLVPFKVWAGFIVVIAVFGIIASWNVHERHIGEARSAATIAALQAQIATDKLANQSANDAVTVLEKRLAECEQGRVVDSNLALTAKVAYEAALKDLGTHTTVASARTTQVLATTCKDWAAQPACGVAVRP